MYGDVCQVLNKEAVGGCNLTDKTAVAWFRRCSWSRFWPVGSAGRSVGGWVDWGGRRSSFEKAATRDEICGRSSRSCRSWRGGTWGDLFFLPPSVKSRSNLALEINERTNETIRKSPAHFVFACEGPSIVVLRGVASRVARETQQSYLYLTNERTNERRICRRGHKSHELRRHRSDTRRVPG